jgi:nucleoside phosphorylase
VRRILVTFALRQEGYPFARKLSQRAVRNGMVLGRLGTWEIAVCWLGIGFERLDLFASAASEVQPGLIINSGFAGGIRSLLEAGDFVLARNHSSPELLEGVGGSHLFLARGNFASATRIVGPETKDCLKLQSNALAVDMESERLATACRKSSIPFLTARMISDRSDEAVPRLLIGRGVRSLDDIFQAARFAGRMLVLRERLATQLCRLIEEFAKADNRARNGR